MTPELKAKILAAADGTKTGAILRCALGANQPGQLPQFVDKASITSDGFVMCDFIDQDGNGHHGAFVGGWLDLVANLDRLAAHMSLTTPERLELLAVVKGWVGQDYRSQGARA